VLGLETLFFADEVRSASDVVHHGFSTDVSERELNLAIQLIDALGMDWDATRFPDTYRERVMDLIRSKGEGLETVTEEEPAAMPQVADLMAALRASVEEAKRRQRVPRAGRRGSGTSA
jgi:DNA end-binding protein Ku